ncbi:ATP-binding protein [Crassaminicella thermophila]|uniref:ATP-binding protein n=1 Tax=Crassaminicella thermophila TaxID=2599308 RepID=A0A5C0SER1_CRATE|nr:ATP-binding protein [Crassaminicella thermophila]QEK11784.1 ATP-binding protein [Crassaminicella thermophila]
MAKRIAVLGGPRSGKTTLIQQLYVDMKIMGYNVGYAFEYSTDYLREKGMIESIAEQYGIYLGQKRLEDSLSEYEYALTDYTTFVPYIYGRFMLGMKKRTKKEIEILKDLYILALEDIPKYDHIIYLPREFGYEQDGIRWQDEELAKQVDEAILMFLKSENIPYVEITGTTKERAKKVLELLEIDQAK